MKLDALSPPQCSDLILNKLDHPIPIIHSSQNVFHDLMSCIIEQQIHYRSTKRLFQKRLDVAGLSELTPANFDQFSVSLSQIKLSQRKKDTIAHTYDFFQATQTDWHSLTDEDVHHTLSAIKGIGGWTIDMILLYTLERADIFPGGDYHLKKIMTTLYDLPEGNQAKKRMVEIAEQWRPYRSYAVLKLLAWKDWQQHIR